MSDELHALLARASNEIEGAAPSLDGGRLGVVRSAARRRRIARRTAESFAGVGVVGVLGVGLWFGLGQQTPGAGGAGGDPDGHADADPDADADRHDATPTPTGPPTRAESIDDATVIARLSAPRTGEVWQTPVAGAGRRRRCCATLRPHRVPRRHAGRRRDLHDDRTTSTARARSPGSTRSTQRAPG